MSHLFITLLSAFGTLLGGLPSALPVPVRVLSSRFRRLYLRYIEQAYTAGKLRFHGQLQHLSHPASFAATWLRCEKPNGCSTQATLI
jgi:hypothetical protein